MSVCVERVEDLFELLSAQGQFCFQASHVVFGEETFAFAVAQLEYGGCFLVHQLLNLRHVDNVVFGVGRDVRPLLNADKKQTKFKGPFTPSASTSVDARLRPSTDVDALGVNGP